MTENSERLWKSLCELGDHFSRLGGSARYANMRESEISLYVAAHLLRRHIPSFEPEEFLDRRFIVAASPVLEKVHAHVGAVNAEGEELAHLIREFIQYADSKLGPLDRSSRWVSFVDMVNSIFSQQDKQGKPLTIEEVLAVIQNNKRVCPQPQKWQQLYDMLPSKQRKGAAWVPPLPLILGAWRDTPDMSKMLRLREHIEWADAHGYLEEVSLFLLELPEEQWHHIGENS